MSEAAVTTTEEAITCLTASAPRARVLRATIHEPEGDRTVWFVRDAGGWTYICDDDRLIMQARYQLERDAKMARDSPVGTSTQHMEWKVSP